MNGIFKFWNSNDAPWFTVERAGYNPARQLLDSRRPRPIATIRLNKLPSALLGLGDVVEVIPCTNFVAQSIGFRDGQLWLLGFDDQKGEAMLVPTDWSAKRPLLPGERLPFRQRLSSFAHFEGRTLFLRTWFHTQVYERTSTNLQPLLMLTNPVFGTQIKWPFGCAFDGKLLWFVENDGSNDRFGLHALDLERGKIVQSLRSADRYVKGLAWDGSSFWLSSRRRVYEVIPKRALRLMTTEAGLGREFSGTYTALACGAGHLWGLDGEHRQICKIKLED